MKIDSIISSGIIAHSHLKKTKSSVTKFNILADEEDEYSDTVQTTSIIHHNNPFLALQQLDYEPSESTMLLTASKDLIGHLQQIILNLTHGDFNNDDIKSLSKAVEQRKLKFNSPEIQDLYDEIYLRASVELEKIKRQQLKV